MGAPLPHSFSTVLEFISKGCGPRDHEDWLTSITESWVVSMAGICSPNRNSESCTFDFQCSVMCYSSPSRAVKSVVSNCHRAFSDVLPQNNQPPLLSTLKTLINKRLYVAISIHSRYSEPWRTFVRRMSWSLTTPNKNELGCFYTNSNRMQFIMGQSLQPPKLMVELPQDGTTFHFITVLLRSKVCFSHKDRFITRVQELVKTASQVGAVIK